MKWSEEQKTVLEKLGAKVREMRTLKNFSQTKLASLINSEKTNLSRLENGNTNPTFLTLKKIADILRVHVCDLMPLYTNTNDQA